MTWRPIDSAPKDKTVIWGWSAERGMEAILFVGADWWTDSPLHEDPITPTHWMPLPDPPSERAQYREGDLEKFFGCAPGMKYPEEEGHEKAPPSFLSCPCGRLGLRVCECAIREQGSVKSETLAPGELLAEELQARGWTIEDLVSRMPGDYGVNYLAIELLLAVPRFPISEQKGILVGETLAQLIGDALGVSAEFWLNLDRSFQASLAGSHAPAPAEELEADHSHHPNEAAKAARANKKAARSQRKSEMAESVKGRLGKIETRPAFPMSEDEAIERGILEPYSTLDATGPELSSGKGKATTEQVQPPRKK